jgi:eukaryotic-like serine/threonine-protein kinase
MNPQHEPSATPAAEVPDDPRLLEAVQEYQRRLEAGERPARQDILRRYPDLAEPLAACLDGLDLVHRAAPASAAGRAPSAARDELLGDPLGDFQIVREIGRGGMGIVYEAVQLSLGRRVALKVLPFAATLDDRHLRRFKNEASAAAQLHHTNIVPVYFVGSERGVNFYAMQLIEGHSLATVIEQVRGQTLRASADAKAEGPRIPKTQFDEPTADTVPPNEQRVPTETVSHLSIALSTQRSDKQSEFFRSIAQLMIQAAEGLEHAHQAGIVHRDIKPGNLLVSGGVVSGGVVRSVAAHHSPSPTHHLWITDFGVAQFHAEAGLTQTGDLLGTLRYMSPEQASGQRVLLDHRADIYALGATFYELATLQPIFAGPTRAELLHQILHQDPRPLRAVDPTVPVELETIILKAVGKTPSERYGSARELADDLRRYLEHKPILAKPPTLLERARKWSRRHPSVVVTGVLLLVVCIAGLLVNNLMISQEQVKTQAALKNEKRRAAEARRVVDLLVQVAEEELAEQRESQAARRRLLLTALNYYQDFIETHGGDADAKAELEAGKKRVRSILDELATLEGVNLLRLATHEDVQRDLQLRDDQQKQLTNLREHSWEQFLTQLREHRTLTPEARRQWFYELAKTQEAGLSDILPPQKIQRLRQIEMQLQGTRAFYESYAVEQLKLTAEQKRAIRQIKDEAIAARMSDFSMRNPFDAGKGGPKKGPSDKGGSPKGPPDKGVFGKGPLGGAEWQAELEKSQKAELERILEVLTPEQLARWREMTGAPFEGRLRMFFRPPPPGGPGAGGPGRDAPPPG